MKGKDASGEVSGGKEEHVIRHQRKGDFCYKVAENTVELCSTIGRKIELVSIELKYFAQRFPSSTEGAAWLILAACSEVREGRN